MCAGYFLCSTRVHPLTPDRLSRDRTRDGGEGRCGRREVGRRRRRCNRVCKGDVCRGGGAVRVSFLCGCDVKILLFKRACVGVFFCWVIFFFLGFSIFFLGGFIADNCKWKKKLIIRGGKKGAKRGGNEGKEKKTTRKSIYECCLCLCLCLFVWFFFGGGRQGGSEHSVCNTHR